MLEQDSVDFGVDNLVDIVAHCADVGVAREVGEQYGALVVFGIDENI